MHAQAGHIATTLMAAKTPGTSAVVALYDSHELAKKAVREFHKSGFATRQRSIVGKDYHKEEKVVGYYNTRGPASTFVQVQMRR